MSRKQKRRERLAQRDAYRKEQAKKWEPQVVSLLKSGWLGIGYTVANEHNARKRIVTGTAALAEQQEMEAWIAERMAEGYQPLLRYYVAKDPCHLKDSEFAGPILLRHKALGYDVIVEAICTSGDENLDNQFLTAIAAFVNKFHVVEVCSEFALIVTIRRHGGMTTYSNISGLTPDSPPPTEPMPVEIFKTDDDEAN